MNVWQRFVSGSVSIPIWILTITLIASIAGIILGGTAIVLWMQTPSIAYVRSSELVQKYKGMKEVRQVVKTEQQQKKTRLDSLESAMNQARKQLTKKQASLSEAERVRRRKQLQRRQASLKRRRKRLQASIEKRQSRLIQGALNQVNEFVERYAERHDYTVILGTTKSGNLLYGAPAHDITDRLLRELNASYEGSASMSDISDE